MSAGDPATAPIEIRALHKSFGDLEVLRGIDFRVETGEVVCVIGPSGAGSAWCSRASTCSRTSP
jgi:polar amino acid transport system ATP-binding protein